MKTEGLEKWPEAGAAFNIGLMMFRPRSLAFVGACACMYMCVFVCVRMRVGLVRLYHHCNPPTTCLAEEWINRLKDKSVWDQNAVGHVSSFLGFGFST